MPKKRPSLGVAMVGDQQFVLIPASATVPCMAKQVCFHSAQFVIALQIAALLQQSLSSLCKGTCVLYQHACWIQSGSGCQQDTQQASFRNDQHRQAADAYTLCMIYMGNPPKDMSSHETISMLCNHVTTSNCS